MKSKITALLMSLVMMLGLTFAGVSLDVNTASAKSVFAGGEGTKENPYQITSVKELQQMNKNLNAYYVLKNDIDLKGASWESIGGVTLKNMSSNDMSKSFSGSFNGKGHTISNVTCKSAKGELAVGFFECNTGTISNVTFKNIKAADGAMSTGGAVAINLGTIKNVILNGNNKISGTNCVGGVVGGNMGGAITKCTVSGTTVNVTGSNDFSDGQIIQNDTAECGGLIVGGGFQGTVNDCSAKGTVIATGKEAVGLGGIGGCLQCMKSISGNVANVTIKAENAHAVGGLCGYAGMGDDGTGTVQVPCKIKNCKVTIDIDADKATHVGGLVGTGLYYYGMEDCYEISNCSVTGSIDGAVTPGTVAGRATGSKIVSCKTNVKVDGKKSSTKIGTTYKLYQSADQYEAGSKKAAEYLLKNVSGTYEELFGQLNQKKYDEAWFNNAKAILGEDQAQMAVNMLKAAVSGKLYGQAAVDAYTEDSSKASFNCGFLQGVTHFTFNGNTISGTDSEGNIVFSHIYEFIGYDSARGFYEYQTKDANAGEFTYILLAADTMGTTAHIEFRYGSSLQELIQFTTGSYAYWMASGIQRGVDSQVAENAIGIFCKENLKSE